jgi:seryl-tRNA synthetase
MTVDFERGAKVAGSKFYFLTGGDAIREWELINRMIGYHIARGWTFVIPPYLVNRKTAEHAGILPRFEGQFYTIPEDGLIAIPTAETPLVGMHSDEIIPAKALPLRYVAFSPCFRREAGAGGQRDKGLKRVHQFHKVELFVICRPEHSAALHVEMVAYVCRMIDDLFPRLTYRKVELPEWDRSPVSASTIDIELLVNGEWLEVSSISNMTDNQSRPAQVRFKNERGRNEKVHMLNGSALALPRLTLALDAHFLTEENSHE